MRRALVVALIVGCGGAGCDGSAGGGDESAGDINELVTSITRAICQYDQRCGFVVDLDTCIPFLEPNVERSLRSALLAVGAGKATYDPSKVEGCLDKLAGATCDGTDADLRDFDLGPGFPRWFPDPCGDVILGTLHADEGCASDNECISYRCELGACVGDTRPVPAHVGERCDYKVRCVSGATCDPRAFYEMETCVPLLPAGSPCGWHFECDYGLACAGQPAVCKALPVLGEPCPDGLCRDAAQYCAVVCQAVGLPGDSCDSLNDTCSVFYTCDVDRNGCNRPICPGVCAIP